MIADPVRWAWAMVAVVVWLAITAWVVWRARSSRGEPGATGQILIAVASQTGFGDELAGMMRQQLSAAGQPVRVASLADLEAADLTSARNVLFIASTTGEGDAPDSAARFVRRVLTSAGDLSAVSYGLLALGDRSYRDFCGFGRALDDALRQRGARALFEAIEVDNGDTNALRAWQAAVGSAVGSEITADWTTPAHQPWRLVERQLMNPGSPGQAAWHLAFEPLKLGADWQAGDIAEVIGPDGPDGPVQREYSIASLPQDGQVALLVRRHVRQDGTPGLLSGWLTGELSVGETLPMRLRRNPAFHAPAPPTPLILIGNGTGIAGLRAHLKARAASRGGGDVWLMFGERTSAHDAFYDDDLRGWLKSGMLTRLDRTFSRDPGDGRYVQAVIAAEADEVRGWVARGAAVYVCGSLDGMATGVHAALEAALGTEALRDLIETGRYRRDVY